MAGVGLFCMFGLLEVCCLCLLMLLVCNSFVFDCWLLYLYCLLVFYRWLLMLCVLVWVFDCWRLGYWSVWVGLFGLVVLVVASVWFNCLIWCLLRVGLRVVIVVRVTLGYVRLAV